MRKILIVVELQNDFIDMALLLKAFNGHVIIPYRAICKPPLEAVVADSVTLLARTA